MDDLGLDDFDPDAPLEDYDDEYKESIFNYVIVKRKKKMTNQDVEQGPKVLTVEMKIWKQKAKNIYLAKHAHNLINDLSSLEQKDIPINLELEEQEAERRLLLEEKKLLTSASSKVTKTANSTNNTTTTTTTEVVNRRRSSSYCTLSPLPYDYLCKILILGDVGVGKTSISLKYINGIFYDSLLSTNGVDFDTKMLNEYGYKIKLEIWDTSGKKEFHNITKGLYKGANGILIVYDVSNRNTFENLNYWMENIKNNAKQNVHVIVVGNKSDIKERQVSVAEGKNLCKPYNISYYDISTKRNRDLNNIFLEFTENILIDQFNAYIYLITYYLDRVIDKKDRKSKLQNKKCVIQ